MEQLLPSWLAQAGVVNVGQIVDRCQFRGFSVHLEKVRFVGEKILKVVTLAVMQLREFLSATMQGRSQQRIAEHQENYSKYSFS